ncbi:chromate transporter [Clostridium sp. YIM B02515]|uniref:Chromate transporter n=1 Tax=Clostridium rhizosphaerae TaxID=2803861 RepID=A0ABS1T930_9CLOT|nr:chromate transporter [Clostridium rhizosphaerae]MBL4935848.1 chromate transporter [Clostridium rhizosphaerae]
MKKLWEIFIVFFKIGTFTIGGGYAMIPLIEKEVVDKRGWIDRKDFIELLALGQSAPGPIAVDTAVFVGYKLAGIWGSILAVLGSVLTAFIVMVVYAATYMGFKDNAIIQRVFLGIRPAIVALIAVPVLRIGKSSNITKKTIYIPILTVFLIVVLNMNPIYIIIISALGGLIYGIYKERAQVKGATK